MKYEYILTSKVNYAETSRDEDNIVIEQLGVFSSVEQAKEYAESTNKLFHVLPNAGWWESEDGTVKGTTGGSWAKVYTITKREIKLPVQIDKVITKILDYDTMSEIAQITQIDLECQTDIWIDYDDLIHGYPKLIEKNYVTSEELELLKNEKADYVAFRLNSIW